MCYRTARGRRVAHPRARRSNDKPIAKDKNKGVGAKPSLARETVRKHFFHRPHGLPPGIGGSNPIWSASEKTRAQTSRASAEARFLGHRGLVNCTPFLTVYDVAGHFVLGYNQVFRDGLLVIVFVRHVFHTTDCWIATGHVTLRFSSALSGSLFSA